LPVVLYGCETWSLTVWEERNLRVFEDMVLRKIFGPKRDEVTGKWRKLYNVVLNDLFCSPNIVRVIKSRRIRWEGYVARMGERKGLDGVLVGKREEKAHLEDPSVDGKIRLIFRKWNVGAWAGLSWLRIGTGGRHV